LAELHQELKGQFAGEVAATRFLTVMQTSACRSAMSSAISPMLFIANVPALLRRFSLREKADHL
jgi:hypothetical protein